MNNELGRKITSLTLMTIMIAGGMTFAAPSMMPAAFAANANLFVSAENSQFDNYMSGPQVIEVVVIDSDINDTDEAKGEPDVTVNGKNLRMAQAVDGNWYGYFADKTMAQTADALATTNGSSVDFGTFVNTGVALNIFGADFGESEGIFVDAAATPANGVTNGTTMNVVREEKILSSGLAAGKPIGQIFTKGMTATDPYPIIQLYNLNPTGNVVVQYNKGGGVQTTTLTFDTVDQFAGLSLDRTKYPLNAAVHATITDLWLNIDPTDEDSWTFATNSTNSTSYGTYYQVFTENGGDGGVAINLKTSLSSLMCEDNCALIVNPKVQGSKNVLTIQDNADSIIIGADNNIANARVSGEANLGKGSFPVTITEQGPNSGIFGTYDESDKSALIITSDAARGTSASIDYNETPVTILVGFDFATVDIQPTDAEWTSGEEIPVILVDGDANLNSRADEDLDLNDANVDLIPSLSTGDPFTLGEAGTGAEPSTKANAVYADITITPAPSGTSLTVGTERIANMTVQKFSERAIVNGTNISNVDAIIIDYQTNVKEFRQTFKNSTTFEGFNFFNLDVRSLSTSGTWDVYLLVKNDTTKLIKTDGQFNSTGNRAWYSIANDTAAQDLVQISSATAKTIANALNGQDTRTVGLILHNSALFSASDKEAIAADFFSFGYENSGELAGERIANQIVRIEAEETGDNTSTFEGSLEFVMVNQLNILDANTYANLSPIADDPTFIVIEDLTDEDAPRVNYNDKGADGVTTQIADQQEAPSHSGVVSFDSNTYKIADTVTVTLEDLDLNVDSDLIDIYTVVGEPTTNKAFDTVGKSGLPDESFGNLGRLLDITFNDQQWKLPASGNACRTALSNDGIDNGLGSTGFTLIETDKESGIFVGDFQVPSKWCDPTQTSTSTYKGESVTGLDMEVNYVDFRDASGEIIEVGDGAGIRANTGSVSLDRTVYPVPFGIPTDGWSNSNVNTPSQRSVFPIHQTGLDTSTGLQTGEYIANGDLTIHVRVNDPDFDISASGEDVIATNSSKSVGPVKISVIRGSDKVVLGYAGGPAALDGFIDIKDDQKNSTRQFGPMVEIAPDAGIFESDIAIKWSDGPSSTTCPAVSAKTSYAKIGSIERFDNAGTDAKTNHCILQGDILQVEYTDPTDASGDENTVTDSATFDLRNGVLQSDKSVYIIGSDMILTLIEPDFDLDNDQAETYDLDLIEWDSDAATLSMGDKGGSASNFDPEPTDFRETGDSTGIFQIVIEIPEELKNDRLERGEEIVLEYTDWGPSGSDYVGDEDEDVNLTIYTSNFGATVELDQKVYTWTDKVYITIVAPDHNFDSNLVDEIGNSDKDPIKVSTRGHDLDKYKLVETGTDTGIFTGEVILTGFSSHDADGDGTTGDAKGTTSADNGGPTDGLLPADDDDGITVSFEFSEDETVVGSALIRWNIGEVQWLEASYPASGTGVVRIIDPDMNFDPEAVDNFDVDVWSDSDAGGIDLTVTETNEATGIFEGTVFFTTTDESSGHRLRVAEGDTVTAEYEDNTLPDPYTTADELDITATSLIGTVVPPLERAPAANLRTVDAFGNSLDSVKVDQQVQITADLANGQDREQAFAYLVQIQDDNGVTVSLAWITGSLSAGQSFSPALSWIPSAPGTYTATAFVWESVDNPTALSPPVSTTVTVN